MLDTTTDNSRLFVAFHEAADHIERHPELFNFSETSVPHECGTPGCAAGWIAHFYDPELKHISELKKLRAHEGGLMTFYNEMNRLVGYDWIVSAALCAKGLRLYAERLMVTA